MPTIVKEEKYRFLMGLVSISYLVEDRYPEDEATINPVRYKHHISVRTFGTRRLNWTFRTGFLYEYLPYIGE